MSDPVDRQLYQDRWQRGRFYAVKRAPYFAPYILKLRPIFTPGTGQITVGKGWECRVDPDLMDSDGDLWKLQLLWAHHLYHRHLARRGDRDEATWSLACKLSAVDAWSTVMKREDTIEDYPGVGWPEGVITPEELGLDPGLSPEQYYEHLYDPNNAGSGGGPEGQSPPEPVHVMGMGGKGNGKPEVSEDGEGRAPAGSAPEQDPPGAGSAVDNSPAQSPPAKGASDGGGDQSRQKPEPSTGGGAQKVSNGRAPAPAPSTPPPGPIDLKGSEQPEDMNMDALEEVVRKKAGEHAGLSPGTLPGDLERAIEPGVHYRVPVERKLQRLIGRAKGRSDWAMTGRPTTRTMNREDGAVLPSLSRGLPEVVFLIDSSGSMDGEMLSAALRVGERVCKATATQLAVGDTTLNRLDRRELTPGAMRRARGITGGGGTDMAECVRQVARQARGKAIVVFTDGLFRWPESKAECGGADVIWVLLKHPSVAWRVPAWVEPSVLRVERGDLSSVGMKV